MFKRLARLESNQARFQFGLPSISLIKELVGVGLRRNTGSWKAWVGGC
jgi:hypothetical protein